MGACPRCRGGEVILGQKDFGCHRWREGCRFVLRRSVVKGRVLSDAQVRALLTKGYTRPIVVKEDGGRGYKGRLKLQGEKVVVERL